MIAVAMMTMVSCDQIEDAINDIKDNQEAQVTDNGLQVSLSFKQSGYSEKHTATFEPGQGVAGLQDTLCTSYLVEKTFLTQDLARLAYNAICDSLPQQEVQKRQFELKDKTISYNEPTYVGMSKFLVKGQMQLYCNTINQAVNAAGGFDPNKVNMPSGGSNPGQGGQSGQGGQGQGGSQLYKFNPQFTESEDGLKITYTYNDFTQSISRMQEVYFETVESDTLCTAYNYTDTYAREDIAQYEFEHKYSFEDLEPLNYQINGAVITHSDPDFIGVSKARIKQSILISYNTQVEMDAMQ